MNEEFKQQLLNEFSSFLDSAEAPHSNAESPERTVDLYSVLKEIIALKTEVKIEARQFKSVLEQFQAQIDQSNRDKTVLGECLEQSKANLQKEKDLAMRALLVQLLDLRDRLDQGLQAAGNYRSKRFYLFRPKREQALIEGLGNGQALTLKRLDQLLASYEVAPIPVIDQAFDPKTMRAAEIEQRPDLENGLVTGELRSGYFWREEVLRVAEVKVNKVD